MTKPFAVVDYTKCNSARCGTGVCLLIAECKLKLIKQEEPRSVPFTLQDLCKGCGDCIKLCPQKAIYLI